MTSLTKDYETSKNEKDRLAEKYQNDLRRLRFLNGLLARALQIGVGKGKATQNESTHSLKHDDKKREFADLDSREKELLISKLLKLLDSQLEVVLA